MHRVDGPGHAPGNLFRAGDPSVGTPATTVTPDWCNAVQEELVNVVSAAGIALNKPDNTQLLAAINTLLRSAKPVGETKFGYWAVAPAGTVEAAGGLFSRTGACAALWAHAQAAGLVVSEAAWAAGSQGMFAVGDGATTFRVPDLRGEHIRVWDHGRNVDAGRALGSRQAGQNAAHTHTFVSEILQADGTSQFGDTFNVTGDTPSGGSNVFESSSSGGSETRVRTVALMAVIVI